MPRRAKNRARVEDKAEVDERQDRGVETKVWLAATIPTIVPSALKMIKR
jgi:hypothetical protein